MQFCILSWAILFGTAQLVVADEEIRVRNAHDADPKVEGIVRPTNDQRNPLTAGLPTPKTAIYEMEEEEGRLLRGETGDKKRHSVFVGIESQAPESQVPVCQAPTGKIVASDRRMVLPRRFPSQAPKTEESTHRPSQPLGQFVIPIIWQMTMTLPRPGKPTRGPTGPPKPTRRPTRERSYPPRRNGDTK